MCWHDLNYLYCFYSVIHIYYFQYLYYSIYYKSFTQCLTPRLNFKSQSTPYKLPPTLGSQCCLHRNSRDCSLARCFFTLQWVLWISMLSKPARFRRYAEVGDIPNGSGEEIFVFTILFIIAPRFKSCYLSTTRCQVCNHPSSSYTTHDRTSAARGGLKHKNT